MPFEFTTEGYGSSNFFDAEFRQGIAIIIKKQKWSAESKSTRPDTIAKVVIQRFEVVKKHTRRFSELNHGAQLSATLVQPGIQISSPNIELCATQAGTEIQSCFQKLGTTGIFQYFDFNTLLALVLHNGITRRANKAQTINLTNVILKLLQVQSFTSLNCDQF